MASSSVAAAPIEPAAPLLAAPRRQSTVGWQIASGIRRNPAAIVSLVVLLIVIIAAIFATSLPFTYDHQDIRKRNAPPSRSICSAPINSGATCSRASPMARGSR